MHDETSIQRQLQRESSFRPPYCPNSGCANHFKDSARVGFCKKHGRAKLRRFPYLSQRFRCGDCRQTFSASAFELYYCQKVWGSNELIFEHRQDGVSMRSIARKIKRSEHLVRTRLRKMSQWAELKHADLSGAKPIEEPVVYDGLENFSFSQYDPNNINHAVGKRSLFIYDFNFSPMNRKGSMSPWQEKKKRWLEEEYGPYPKSAIRTATTRIFERLVNRTKGKELTIFSDRHFQYARSVQIDLAHCKITHIKVSSKIHRNFQNPLFAVNNVDLQARHNQATFKRETIAFSKHEIAMQDSFNLYAAYRNYMRPKFWGTHRSDPKCSITSPAMELGLTDRILSFGEFFSERVRATQVKLNSDALERLLRICTNSRRRIATSPIF